MKLLPTDPTLETKMIEAWQEYLRRAPEDDPDRPQIERLLGHALARRSSAKSG
jgi:cytochrome c-type biogenesis protein CcmH/NrfG